PLRAIAWRSSAPRKAKGSWSPAVLTDRACRTSAITFSVTLGAVGDDPHVDPGKQFGETLRERSAQSSQTMTRRGGAQKDVGGAALPGNPRRLLRDVVGFADDQFRADQRGQFSQRTELCLLRFGPAPWRRHPEEIQVRAQSLRGSPCAPGEPL